MTAPLEGPLGQVWLFLNRWFIVSLEVEGQKIMEIEKTEILKNTNKCESNKKL